MLELNKHIHYKTDIILWEVLIIIGLGNNLVPFGDSKMLMFSEKAAGVLFY